MRTAIAFLISCAALLALALPSFASATQGLSGSFNEATEEFEGTLKLEIENGPLEGNRFQCETTAVLSSEGEAAAEIIDFTITTQTCESTSPMYSGCQIVGDEWSVPFIEETTVKYHFQECVFGFTLIHLEFTNLSFNPEPEMGPISTLTVTGTSKSEPAFTLSGTLHAETDEELELIP